MKRLYSYILKSFIGPFIMTFFICVFILIMQFLWRYLDEFVGKGLENAIIVELMSYAALTTVPLALPLAVLLASIMTFGNLGERFELIAIKASGVSLLKIMRPLIIFNILVSIGAFLLANHVIPVTNVKFAALLHSVKEQRPEMIVKEGIFSNDIEGISIKVSNKNPETGALLNIMIYDHRERKGNVNVTLADSGYLNISDDKQFMILTLFDGESYSEAKTSDRGARNTHPFQRERFKSQRLVLNVRNFDLKRADESFFKDLYKMLSNDQLASVIDSFQVKYTEQVELVSVSMNYNTKLDIDIRRQIRGDSLLSIKFDSLENKPYETPFDTLLNQLEFTQKKSVLTAALRRAQANQRVILQYQSEMGSRMVWINKHIIEWHKKYTLSIACLLFFFIGAPLGAIIRKGGFGMPVVVSILLFISYYLVSVIGEKVARDGTWKIEMVLWFSTVLYLAIGIVLTHQAVTDSFLLNSETYGKFINSLNIFKLKLNRKKK